MGKVPSKYERFKAERDQKIIDRYKQLSKEGTNKLVAYRIISEELNPPVHEITVSKILARHGLNTNQSKFGRKRKVVEPI
jgi:hypothetical protein